MPRESTLHLLLYATAGLLAVFLTIHVALHAPGIFYDTYKESVERESVRKNYENFGWALVALLIVAVIHGLIGLRGILLELRQGPRWEAFVNFLIVFLGAYMIGLGTYTLISWLGIIQFGG